MYEAAKLLLFLPSLCIDALQCIEKLVHNFKLWIVYYYYEFHNPAVVAKDAVPGNILPEEKLLISMGQVRSPLLWLLRVITSAS